MPWLPCRYDCGNAAEHGGVCIECRQANVSAKPQRRVNTPPMPQDTTPQDGGSRTR